MAFQDCEQINNLFIQAPEYIYPNLIYERFRSSNAYYGVVAEEEFVSGKGTTHTGRRLNRIAPPRPCNDWEPVISELCQTNACDFDPSIVSHGSEAYNWRIVQKHMRTDWFCLEALAFEPFTEQEMAQIQESLVTINREVQEEFIRSRYIDNIAPENKWLLVGTGADDPCEDVCIEPLRESWFFADLANGEPDTCFVYVGVSVANLANIAYLNNGMLDLALSERQYVTDDIAWVDETMELYPLYLPDVQESNYLARSLDAASNFIVALGGNNMGTTINNQMLTDKYGLMRRTNGNFAHKIDHYAMRFYPDTAYNADLPTFDFDDTTTWPRLFRVFPYRRVASTIGVQSQRNAAYLKAPFSISVLFHPMAGAMQRMRPVKGYGAAVAENIPDVEFKWENPPWACNIRRTKGFFMNTWKLAWRPNRREYAYGFLHRRQYGIKSLDISGCPLPEEPYCPAEAVPYCCVTADGLAPCTDSSGQNYVQDTIINITPTINS
jgi:hypothetical protein